MEESPDFRELENKLGLKVPESLVRAIAAAPETGIVDARADDVRALHHKLRFLREQMVFLRAIDLKLMRQLLSINEGIESVRWVMEERGGVASREGSLAGSFGSLSDSQGPSHHSSLSDGLDGISVGSYLDTLGEEDDPERSSTSDLYDPADPGEKAVRRPRVDGDEYYCFG